MFRVFGLPTLAAAIFLTTSVANAAIFVKYEGIPGEVVGPDGTVGWFVADSFSFGVEREMKESGEKGGTQDINIGVGELQECTISKSMDSASPLLAQKAFSGRSMGSVDVCVTDTVREGAPPVCYLKYKLDRVFIKSWSTSGDADDRPTEEVAFYYNKIAFVYDAPGIPDNEVIWDREKRRSLKNR